MLLSFDLRGEIRSLQPHKYTIATFKGCIPGRRKAELRTCNEFRAQCWIGCTPKSSGVISNITIKKIQRQFFA
jgi:hypothetical protein